MLNGNNNENGKKSKGLIQQKKTTLHLQHTIFVHFFLPLFCTTRGRNFLVYTRFIEETSYVFLFIFFSLALIFTLEAASMCHFLSASIKFSCFPSKEIRHLCILSFALAFSSVTQLSVDIRIQSKKKKKLLRFAVVFSLEKSGWPCDLPPKTRGCQKCELLAGSHEGVDVRPSVRTCK